MALCREKVPCNLPSLWTIVSCLAICVLMLSLSGCGIGAFFALFVKKSPTIELFGTIYCVIREEGTQAGNLPLARQ